MNKKDKPNKVTAKLRVVVTGEFYGDDATEEVLRYCVEQDLEDAGFDVDVAVLKEQEAVKVTRLEIAHLLFWCCGSCGVAITFGDKFCRMCGKPILWRESMK